MTTPAIEVEPACPGAPAPGASAGGRSLVAVRRPFQSIPTATWDALIARSPWATPFARWAFHRAWWDAYGVNAHDQTLVVLDPATESAADSALPREDTEDR